MLRRIFTITNGDFRVIEDGQGNRYRLSGPTRAALSPQYRAELTHVALDRQLIDVDPAGVVADASLPQIEAIASGDQAGTYLAHVENGGTLVLSAAELKTLLDAPQLPRPLR